MGDKNDEYANSQDQTVSDQEIQGIATHFPVGQGSGGTVYGQQGEDGQNNDYCPDHPVTLKIFPDSLTHGSIIITGFSQPV